jgi:hypothetical protein
LYPEQIQPSLLRIRLSSHGDGCVRCGYGYQSSNDGWQSCGDGYQSCGYGRIPSSYNHHSCGYVGNARRRLAFDETRLSFLARRVSMRAARAANRRLKMRVVRPQMGQATAQVCPVKHREGLTSFAVETREALL